MIAKMKEAKLATVGVTYRRQFTFADIDLTLHDVHPEGHDPIDEVVPRRDGVEHGPHGLHLGRALGQGGGWGLHHQRRW